MLKKLLLCEGKLDNDWPLKGFRIYKITIENTLIFFTLFLILFFYFFIHNTLFYALSHIYSKAWSQYHYLWEEKLDNNWPLKKLPCADKFFVCQADYHLLISHMGHVLSRRQDYSPRDNSPKLKLKKPTPT